MIDECAAAFSTITTNIRGTYPNRQSSHPSTLSGAVICGHLGTSENALTRARGLQKPTDDAAKTTTTTWTTTSDARVKRNVQDFVPGLETILELRGRAPGSIGHRRPVRGAKVVVVRLNTFRVHANCSMKPFEPGNA